ncbi:hypothetical protein PG985_011617 [Apiospora marii]|uniref:uncharacterized protein n=1 Tax=Apiospora marii TaxID=335849 RepID=UPI00312E7F59
MAHDRIAPNLEPRGYPKLAKFMVEHDYVMMRQFRQLAIRDLLYLQAELCELEHELTKQGIIDANAADERKFYDREWWFLHQGEARGMGGEQWNLVLKVRAKLREYYAAVQQYQSIGSLQRPSQDQRKQLHKYTNCESLGGHCGFLGKDLGEQDQVASVYDQINLQDLLYLREDTLEDDFLSHLITGPILRLFHQVWRFFKPPLPYDEEAAGNRGQNTALWYYSNRHIRLVTNIIGSGVSSLLPMLSIITLFYVEDTLARLGLVCAFTVVFSLCMVTATQCRRVEIFGATAANASPLAAVTHTQPHIHDANTTSNRGSTSDASLTRNTIIT